MTPWICDVLVPLRLVKASHPGRERNLACSSSSVTHFVPVTLCVMQKARGVLRLYGMTHNVTGTKCVTGEGAQASKRKRSISPNSKKFENRVLRNSRNRVIYRPALMKRFDKCGRGGMADAHGSGPCGGNPVEVQLLSPAPSNPQEAPNRGLFLLYARLSLGAAHVLF